MDFFKGLRTSEHHGDDDLRPKDWRSVILKLAPAGTAPMFAFSSRLRKERVRDPEFKWLESMDPTFLAAVTNIFTDSACTTAYTSGGSAGDILYVKISTANEEYSSPKVFVEGLSVILSDDDDPEVDVVAKIIQATITGTNTATLAVKLLEDDDNSSTHDLSDCDRISVLGSVNPEAAEMPTPVSWDPEIKTNYTQIFRHSLKLSRTALRTKVRYGDSVYMEMKAQALLRHSRDIELSFLFGVPSLGVGSNAEVERTTGGLRHFIPSSRRSNYTKDSDFSGKTWVQGGEDWLNKWFKELFKYGGSKRLCFAGSSALLAVNTLAKEGGEYQLEAGATLYGIRVTRWITPFGAISINTHPLFNTGGASLQRSMIIFDPNYVRYRYVDDTHFKPDKSLKKGEWTSIDGIAEEYLTEAGLEAAMGLTSLWLTGFGLDNS